MQPAQLATMSIYPSEFRKAICNTGCIESGNGVRRKVVRICKSFPSEWSVIEGVSLAIDEAQKKWTMPIQHWKMALQQFAIMLEHQTPNNLIHLKDKCLNDFSLQVACRFSRLILLLGSPGLGPHETRGIRC